MAAAVKTFSLEPSYAAGELFAVWVNAGGAYWNQLAGAFESYDGSNWLMTKYLVAVSANGKSGEFRTTVPPGLPGSTASPALYKLAIYHTPTTAEPNPGTDYAVLEGPFAWDGAAEVVPGAGGGSSSSAGSGDVAVNHATEDDDGDTMEVQTAGGAGVDDVAIRAYVASEWAADPGTATVRGETRSLADGTWREPLMLDGGVTYTIVFSKSGNTIESATVTP
jgi:hypothetical protein